MLLLVEILESLVSQTQLITAAKGEELDLASLVSSEISAMDQAIEEVSQFVQPTVVFASRRCRWFSF